MSGMRGLQSMLLGVFLAVSLSLSASSAQGPFEPKTTFPPAQTPHPEVERTTSTESQKGVTTPQIPVRPEITFPPVKTPQVPAKPETTFPPVKTPQVPVRLETIFPPVKKPQVPVKPETTFPPVKKPQVPVRPETTFPPVKTPQVPVKPETTFPPVKTPQIPVRPETIFPPVKKPQVPVRLETTFPPVKTPQVPVKPETTFPPVKTPQVPVRLETTFPPVKKPQVPVRPEATFPPVKTPQVPVKLETAFPPVKTPQALVKPKTIFPPAQTPQVPVRLETTFPPAQTPQPEPEQTTSTEFQNGACTTRWFNQDDPSGIGDHEILFNIMDKNPDAVCYMPIAIEVQTLDGIPASETGQEFFLNNAIIGFSCINHMQGKGEQCLDYRVRFTCPKSFCSGGKIQTTPGSECVTLLAPTPTLEEVQSSPHIPVKGGQVQSTPGPEVVTPPVPNLTLDQVQSSPQTAGQEVPFICKTRWFNQDNPSGDGDHELLADLQRENPKAICSEPSEIEVQTVDGIPASQTGQKFIVSDAVIGFSCINDEQGKGQRCHDYRVRFTCEHLFCIGSEAQTTPGPEAVTSPAPTSTLEQVQNSSSRPVKVCKTKWLNRDNPSATGDYELIYYFRQEYPNAICHKPIGLEVQTVDGTPAHRTGQKFAQNDAVNGFACINADQGKGGVCYDYKVRFTCPDSFCSGGG